MDLVKTVHISILTGLDLCEEDTLDKVAEFYDKLYKVLGATENETLTQYMFDVMQTSGTIHSKLEEIILSNNLKEDIIERYIKLICEVAEKERLTDSTLHNIEDMCICEGLSENVCLQLKDNKQYKAFLVNASHSNIEIIDFKDEQIIDTINSIDFLEEKDETISLRLLNLLRQRVLFISEKLAVNHYRGLFMLPYGIITEEELSGITNKEHALSLIDSKQLNDENYSYIASYLCREKCNADDSYYILRYISDIDNVEIRKQMFLALDFNYIQYCSISAKIRTFFTETMSLSFDFSDLGEQIKFMTHTKCTFSPFEKNIKRAIADKKFDDYNDLYAKYIRTAKRITNEMLVNLHAMNLWYSMPPHVTKKLYNKKRYKYYVVAKTMFEHKFSFERDKLDVLEKAYNDIFFSSEKGFPDVKKYMANDFEFVSYMCEGKKYVGRTEYHRIMFVNSYQSVDCLYELVQNFTTEFCVQYLSKIAGFKDVHAAKFFINIVKENVVIAASAEVYENNYDKLVDSDLKGSLTRYHNRAKKIL